MNPKQRAAEAAMQFVKSGMRLGLGTGSTADFFLVALSQAIRDGKLHKIVGVPSSVQSERRAKELEIPLAKLEETGVLDITVDGADEIAPILDLIKGLGGALLREKIVAQNSKQLIIIADESKKVSALGERAALPVEVAQFAHGAHMKFFESLGCEPLLRTDEKQKTFITDNGNVIYDCRFRRIENVLELHTKLLARAGVVETGLFLGMKPIALVGDQKGIERLGG